VSRFPFPGSPTGWYHVAQSADVEPGEVLPMRYFGRELVCFRGAGGAVHVLDAYCPHLGAHLGYGGEVDGDDIVCPFHGWRFDAEGTNVDIPYSARTNRKARLTRWPVVEGNGEVYAWYDATGAPPTWVPPSLPECHDEAFVRHAGERWTMRTHVQEVMENVVDVAHFQYVHRTSGFGALELEEEGHRLWSKASVTFVTPRGDVDGHVISELFGLGIDVVRPSGLGDAAAVFTVTPVEDGLVEAGYTFLVPRARDGQGMSNFGRGLVDDFHKQAQQDKPIWEHKRYQASPALSADDGPIMAFRRWARQFYAEAA
jgi:phenylpropionate dioxygenase-like ring-hydroxylating dioxygenase large terminal subunit